LQGALGTGASFSRTDLVLGTHTITATATDAEALTGSDSVTVTIDPVNSPPTVTIAAPTSGTSYEVGTSILFSGTGSDAEDGDVTASLVWESDLQGPLGTGASFSRTDLVLGTHTITATATDAEALTGTDSVTVTIDPVNSPPLVSAGPDLIITLPDDASLVGTVSDDGQPDPPGGVTVAWSKVSGPGDVSFAPPGAEEAIASFSVPGTYVLRLTADDGALTASDDATVIVNSAPGGTTHVLELRVSTSSDDAEERRSGWVTIDNPDLELVQDGSTQVVGIRFPNVTIPPDAVILSAYVQFRVDEITVDPTTLTIHGESSPNAATFDTSRNAVSLRPTTVAAVDWLPDPWLATGAAGPDQRTPDISSLIAEIVGAGGWASGNALAFIITGAGTRTAEAYDGDPAGAPLLHVEFSTAP
ncbi:MAG TPA: hypothetical protein VFT85_04385, partial [Acidimicrobiia bacterium]|nr:hypothetical protein [Acidimicrobiia bacterium]